MKRWRTCSEKRCHSAIITWGESIPFPLPPLSLLCTASPTLPPKPPPTGVLQDLQKFEEAEDLQRKAVSLCERNLGREHPMTASCISNLAEMVGQEGRMEEAEELAREALQIRQKLLGDEHPATSNSLNNLAGILMEQKKVGKRYPQGLG